VKSFKYISINSIIAKVYEDLNAQIELRIGAIITWACEALEHINATFQYLEKYEKIQIIDHKAKLPCDFFKIKALSVNGYALTADHSTPSGFYHYFNKENIKSDYRAKSHTSFTIYEDEIITGIKSGKGILYYYSIVLDEDGFPMIPDIIEYKEAIFNYIVYKAKFASFVAGKISASECDYFKNNWLSSKHSARIAINIPDIPTMESIGKSFNRLIPKMNDNYNLYKYSSTQEYSN
jgi:hypothetical protein